MFNSVILLLFFIHFAKNEMIYEEIRVCTDSSRVDFANSCKNNNEECMKELNYIKNFADFTDFYFVSNNEVYHSIDDSVYLQNCFKTKQVWLPEVVDRCHEPLNIPCSFQDPRTGQNKSGFYTQYDLIVMKPKRPSRTRRATKKACASIKNLFSVPSGTKKITRDGGRILFEDILINSTPLQFVDFFYKNYGPFMAFYRTKLQNCTLYLVIKDIVFFFFVFSLFCLFFIKVKSFGFYFLNCFLNEVDSVRNQIKYDQAGNHEVILLDDPPINIPTSSTNPKEDPEKKGNKFETYSEITLANMENNSSKIDIELKKKFCKEVIGGRGAIPIKMETLDKKIKAYLNNNNLLNKN